MPITAILIPAADCVLLLHQLVIGPVTVHFDVMVFKCTHYTTCVTLNVSQTGCTVASQLGFERVRWFGEPVLYPLSQAGRLIKKDYIFLLILLVVRVGEGGQNSFVLTNISMNELMGLYFLGNIRQAEG